MKHSEFNTEDVTSKLKCRVIPNFKGNYIRSDPKTSFYRITSQDKYMVLASDGLWDEISCSEVAQDLLGKQIYRSNLAQSLLSKAMAHVSEVEFKGLDQIKALSPGPARRKVHDDISILVVSLKQQSQA
jgi:pyruvate dehydrogenase phosphatase